MPSLSVPPVFAPLAATLSPAFALFALLDLSRVEGSRGLAVGGRTGLATLGWRLDGGHRGLLGAYLGLPSPRGGGRAVRVGLIIAEHRCFDFVSKSRHTALGSGDPLTPSLEAGLAFLPGIEHRRGDEDR